MRVALGALRCCHTARTAGWRLGDSCHAHRTVPPRTHPGPRPPGCDHHTPPSNTSTHTHWDTPIAAPLLPPGRPGGPGSVDPRTVASPALPGFTLSGAVSPPPPPPVLVVVLVSGSGSVSVYLSLSVSGSGSGSLSVSVFLPVSGSGLDTGPTLPPRWCRYDRASILAALWADWGTLRPPVFSCTSR